MLQAVVFWEQKGARHEAALKTRSTISSRGLWYPYLRVEIEDIAVNSVSDLAR
jgi:hypothetical protein